MELIEWILDDKNLDSAMETVIRNKGAAGTDKMSVHELRQYFQQYKAEIKEKIRNKQYQYNQFDGYIFQNQMEIKDR